MFAQHLKQLQSGLAALKPALAGLAWSGDVFFLQGQLLAAQGRKGEAEQAFRKAAGLNPNLAGAPRG